MRFRSSEGDSAHLYLRYQFFDGVRLLAIPFDVTEPQSNVTRTIEELEKETGDVLL